MKKVAGMSVLFVGIFILGAYFHEQGGFSPLFRLYEAYQLRWAENTYLDVRGNGDCQCGGKIKDGECLGMSNAKYESYEEQIIRQTNRMEAYHPSRPVRNFEQYLSEALGLKNLLLKKGVGTPPLKIIKSTPYLGGTLYDYRIQYKRPPVSVRFIYAKHPQKTRQAVIVLHGHGSSANKVMGLDCSDYMRRAGEHWFKRGYDVLAFDLTSNASRSSIIGRRLHVLGMSIYGLWVRAVCDTTKLLDLNGTYRDVVLYGMSNGGLVADQLSVLCPQFAEVIVGDSIEDMQSEILRETKPPYQFDYMLYFMRPLHYETSYIDYMVSTKCNKYYTRGKKHITFLFRNSNRIKLEPGIDYSARVNLVFKRRNQHISELDLVDALLRHDTGVEGLHMN